MRHVAGAGRSAVSVVRLRYIAQVNPATPEFDLLGDDDALTFLPLEAIWPGVQLDTSRVRSKAEVSTGYTRFQTGDILIPKITPTFQANRSVIAAGLLGRLGAGTTELHVVRPGARVDARYLFHTLSARAFLSQGEGSMVGVAGQKRVPDEFLRDYLVRLPELPEQRAIADYLDAETGRLAALVDARRLMIELVDERLDGEITRVLDRPSWSSSPLKWKTKVTVGIVIRPSELYVESGVPCLRGLNVRPGLVNDSDLVFISSEANSLNSKSTLANGDIVVVRTGNAGAAAVVPGWVVGGNCVDLLIIRRPDDIAPRFLEAVLNSAVVRRQIEEESVGALQAHFNTEALANLRVPVPDVHEQRAALASIDVARSYADWMRSALSRQVDLLLERRQALITAAVTGQVELPGVAG